MAYISIRLPIELAKILCTQLQESINKKELSVQKKKEEDKKPVEVIEKPKHEILADKINNEFKKICWKRGQALAGRFKEELIKLDRKGLDSIWLETQAKITTGILYRNPAIPVKMWHDAMLFVLQDKFMQEHCNNFSVVEKHFHKYLHQIKQIPESLKIKYNIVT